MYWYYFQSARGVKIWWKEWITRRKQRSPQFHSVVSFANKIKVQITQFVLDLGFVYFASWDYFTSTYAPSLPHMGTCAGEPYAAVAGCTILSSYLVLFIMFYLATYKKGSKGNQATKASAQTAVVDLKKTEATNIHLTAAKAVDSAHVPDMGVIMGMFPQVAAPNSMHGL